MAIPKVLVLTTEQTIGNMIWFLMRLRLPHNTLLPILQSSKPIEYGSKVKSSFVLTAAQFHEFKKYEQLFVSVGYQPNLFKFILLISQGTNYQQLIENRDEDMLDQECRDWNQNIRCDIISSHALTQKETISYIFNRMDIRGKTNNSQTCKVLQLIEVCRGSGHGDPQWIYFGIQLTPQKNRKCNKNPFNAPKNA